jgi:hypothetical protein
MSYLKFLWVSLALCAALLQAPLSVQAQQLSTATVNYVGSNTIASWVNVNISGGASNVNYLFPSAQQNQMLATALTALSAGKQIQIQYTGGNWSTLVSIMCNQ